MDRGERLRKQHDRIELNPNQVELSDGRLGTSKGTLVLRSSMAFPRMTSRLDLDRVPRSPTGCIADYYERIDRLLGLV